MWCGQEIRFHAALATAHALADKFDSFLFQHVRVLDEVLLDDTFASKEWFLTKDVPEALALALSKAKRDDVILATGSLFVAGEVRECINTKA